MPLEYRERRMEHAVVTPRERQIIKHAVEVVESYIQQVPADLGVGVSQLLRAALNGTEIHLPGEVRDGCACPEERVMPCVDDFSNWDAVTAFSVFDGIREIMGPDDFKLLDLATDAGLLLNEMGKHEVCVTLPGKSAIKMELIAR